jgi:lipid-binding SYLF domain-containing protein
MKYGLSRTVGVAALVASIAFSLPVVADTNGEERSHAEKLVTEAVQTIKNFVADPNMTWFRDNVKNARAVIVVPTLVKGGLVLGGSGGSGVLLFRDEAAGSWRGPAFVKLGSFTAGFQAGGTAAEAVMMAMTERARDTFLSAKFQIGTDLSIAAGPVGGGAAAATSDILQFMRAIGLYGGFNIEGTVVGMRHSFNEAYYGRKVTPSEILVTGDVRNAHANALIEQLTGAARGQ